MRCFGSLLLLTVSACALDRSALPVDGAGPDVGADSGGDAIVLPADTGTDASPLEGGMDSAVDVGTDSSADGGMDASTDAGMDGGADASTDGGADAGTDGGMDGGADATVDARVPFPGTALMFDGTDDFVRTARIVADNFTLEAWIQTTTSRPGSQFYDGLGLIYSDQPGSADDFGAAILNDHFAFGVGNPDTTLESTSVVTTGAWVHVAASRRRSTGEIRVFVNGVLEASVAAANLGPLDRRPDVELGANVVDGRYFLGTMDEVRIWNVVRSGAQIRAAMNLSLTGTEPGLVGYWRFDDGSGGVAADSSPTMTDGALGAGTAAWRPSWVTSTAPIVR